MAFKKFTEDEQAMFLLQLEVLNYPANVHALLEVTKKRGAPSRNTLVRWWKQKNDPHISKLVQHKKTDFIAELKELLGLHIEASIKAVKGNDDLRAIDTGIGIIVDKLQLLQGEPTDIKEVNVTDHRARIMADLARESSGYVVGEPPEVHAKPIG